MDDYEPSGSYAFDLCTTDGTLRDRFTFYGPFSAGWELAQKRAALHDAPSIRYQETR